MDLLARTLTAMTLAVILLALASTSADATHSRGKCKKRGATVAKNDSARVYERGASLYGCAWSRNVEEVLDTASDDDLYMTSTYSRPILRGRFAAWVRTTEDTSCKADCGGYDGTDYYVNVFDIARGDAESTFSDPVLDSLRLNTRGSAAWLETEGPGTHSVFARDFGDEDKRLDEGPIRRFRLRGRTLSWLNGDVQHSVTLR